MPEPLLLPQAAGSDLDVQSDRPTATLPLSAEVEWERIAALSEDFGAICLVLS